MNKSKIPTILFILILIGFKNFAQNPQELGQWSDPIPFNIVPVAVANLPDGRLLTWSSKYHDNFDQNDGFTFTQIFDPSIGFDGAVLPRTVTDTNHDMFCPGINNLADGRILATGGSSSERASIYDPRTEIWTRADDMNIPRGYQGAVTLSDGSAFTIGGSWNGGQGDKDAEIWTEELGWRVLTGLQNEVLWNTDDVSNEPEGVYRIDNHAWLFAAPNGKVFHAGPGETMNWLDVSGNGSSQMVGNRGDDVASQNGGAVMFDIGKIFKYGGSYTYSSDTPSSDNAYVIDINVENNVTVTRTLNDAEQGRIYTSAVALPNGEVLILGGMDTSVVFSDIGAHLSAEMYNPETNTFRTLASMQIPRTYHSAGILLNDGRVFLGGGGLCGSNCPVGGANHLNAEIYSPPYLFDTNGDLAVRPSLSAPEEAFYERVLPVITSSDVTEFAFVRMSSATHSVNNEQRRVPVTHTGSNGNYQLNIPSANLMPPGYYMLFAINSNGVPSISKAVLVGTPDSRVKEDNLLVEFEFFEGNGALVNDTSGKNNNGEIKERDNNGNPVALSTEYWNANGFSGSALQMDGIEFNSNTILEIPTSPSLSALTNQITVMAWVNRDIGSVIPQNDQIPNVSIFAHDYSSFFFGYHNSQYKLEFYTDSGGSASCYTGQAWQYTPGEWEHLVGTYDGNIARLYVNGQEICTSTVTGNLLINTEDDLYNTFTLSGFYDKRNLPVVNYGNSSGITDELDGSMDKFKLYNVALTAQEIESIYIDELDLICPLVGSSCDDGDPNTSNDIEDGDCNCLGTIISCENLLVTYEINGERDSGATEITVSEGDDIGLFLNLEGVDYDIIGPDGNILSSNTINTITTDQSGLYTVNSELTTTTKVTDLTLEYVNSEEIDAEDGRGLRALDGNPDTFWHTEWSATSPTHPHEIQIDLGLELNISGLEYLPRQDNTLNGTIENYQIYVSNSTSNWGTAINTGTWANNKILKNASFPETQARYVRLVALTEVSGGPWASAAEISVIETITTQCVNTIQINVGSVADYTYNNGWLPSDPNNGSNSNDKIKIEAGEAVISMNTIGDIITVNPGAALTVNAGITLTANTTTLKSTSELYSSLMGDGSVEGTIKYERFVNASFGGNDLISPPLTGELWADFLLSGTNAVDILNNGQSNPTIYAFAPFDKTADWYVNYNDQELPDLELISGTGYRAASVAGTTLTFTGTVPTTPITVDIINAGANYPDWNLIGNPYPSYLDMDLFLKHVLFDGVDPDPDLRNIDILEDASGIYGYAGSVAGTKWEVITLSNAPGKLMAPGQGFFVAANDAFVAAHDITFDPSMRAIGTGDDFIAGRNANVLTFLKLNASTSEKDYTTQFYFDANASLGLDHGYDGKILGNVAPNFALYSHLVEDNTGLPIALQALNPSDLTNTIIPLGVNSNQGEQITISISESTLPSNVEVYLEDTVANTSTLLNTGDYILTPNTNLNGTGRFYLRVSSTVLSVGQNDLDYLQIYTTTNPKSLIIKGELNDATKVNLYDIQGRLVLNKALNQFDVLNTVDISRIGSGVYIVKVFSASQVKTQKLVIK